MGDTETTASVGLSSGTLEPLEPGLDTWIIKLMRSRNHRHHLLSVLQCCIPYMLLGMLDIIDIDGRLRKTVDDYVKYPLNSFK